MAKDFTEWHVVKSELEADGDHFYFALTRSESA